MGSFLRNRLRPITAEGGCATLAGAGLPRSLLHRKVLVARVCFGGMNRVLLIPTILLLLIGVLCFTFSASKDPSHDVNRPIVLCAGSDIKTLDPHQMSWMGDIRAAIAMWEGLTANDPDTLAAIPGAAESWEVSPDNRTYTFHLRKDGRWSNGDAVTAQDFIFAWQRMLNPVTGAEYISLFNVIEGAEDYTQALTEKKAADFSKVGIQSPEPLTLVVTLKAPCDYFLSLCAFPPLFPVHEGAMKPFQVDKSDASKGYDGAWTRPPAIVTNGAYMLSEWKFKEYLSLRANPMYWDRAKVRCEHLVIKILLDPRAQLLAYNKGLVDVINNMPSQFGDDLLVEQNSGRRRDVHYRPVFGTYYFQVNCTKKPFDDKRVRKALALAIDKKKIVKDITRMNQETSGVLVPVGSVPGYQSPEALPMNVAEAKRLLAEAGFPEGKGFPTIDLLYTNEAAVHSFVSQAIGQMWEENLGIRCTYRGLEVSGFAAARADQKFDICRAGWYGDYVDPTTWLDLARTKDNNNDGKFSSAAYDALLDKAAMEPDSRKRLELLTEAERILVHEEFPFLPLYQYADGMVYDPEKIGGISLNIRLLTPLKWIHRK
jgi:oligopeptide transport system substrate-binding protein